MKYFKFLLVIAAGGALIHSCNKDFLDKNALGKLEETDVANKKGVEGLLIGAYSLLDGMGGNKGDVESAASNWLYGSVCGSEAYVGSFVFGDLPVHHAVEKFNSGASDFPFADKWGIVYDGIQRSNEVLRVMKKASDISAEDGERIAAEARFLRAHYHFDAVKMWKNVPFVDETITYTAHNYHLSNDILIWPAIENDLVYAMENLKEDPYLGAVGRANKFTAMALLAKAYLFQKKFADAKPLLETIINSGRYHLVNYADNFNPATKNSDESIFAAQMSVNDGSDGLNGNYGDFCNFPGTGQGPGGCCGLFQPSQYLVNHFKTNSGTGLPDPDNYNIEGEDVTSDQGLESTDPFTPYAGTLDPRLDWTVGRRGIPYLDWGEHPGKDWIVDQNLGGPYSPKKNVYYKSQEGVLTDLNFWSRGATANNVNLIRFADVLLWAAEVEAESGRFDKAEDYVNMIRDRMADHHEYWVHKYLDNTDPQAGSYTDDAHLAANYKIEPYPPGYFTSRDVALKAIRFERMLELGMEGHRFFDLVRWGIAKAEIDTYLAKEKNLRTYLNDATFEDCNEVFPIPQMQIDLSAGVDGVRKLKQNPCY